MKTTILFLLILFLADSRHPHSFDGIRKPESQLSESYYSLFEYKHLPSKAVSSSVTLPLKGAGLPPGYIKASEDTD
jgi:hypothetical protein